LNNITAEDVGQVGDGYATGAAKRLSRTHSHTAPTKSGGAIKKPVVHLFHKVKLAKKFCK